MITKREHIDLYNKCETEGGILGGYADYGVDLNAIEKLGFNKKEVASAIILLEEVQSKIYDAENLEDV